MPEKLNRKTFVTKALMVLGGVALIPGLSSGDAKRRIVYSGNDEVNDDGSFKLNDQSIIDLHCHPSMKMWLFDKKFWKQHLFVHKGDNLLPMQENNHQFSFGNVRGILAAHYLLEAATEREWNTLKALYPIIKLIPFFDLKDKIEYESEKNFDQVIKMIDLLEKQIGYTNAIQKDFKYYIAKNFKEFAAALDDPKKKTIAIAHAIEGSHALGRNFPISAKRQNDNTLNNATQGKMYKAAATEPWEPYINNLRKFKERGVCLITLAHFFRNDLVYPVDGISPDAKNTPGMTWEYTPDQDHGLTEIGKKVVEEMLRTGIVVDVCHSAPGVRRDVFLLNRKMNAERLMANKPMRPIVFTHTGARQIFDYYDLGHYPYFKYYCVSDDEIDLISECEGVIGVIPENFWLVGADTHLKKDFQPSQFRYGIDYMVQTMKYINSKTRLKDYSNIGIGTDFDGLADNPKDLYKNRQISDLIAAMKRDPELNQKDYIDNITYKNSRRILERGWGN